MQNKVELHVGYVGITRSGLRVKIDSPGDRDYLWKAGFLTWYADGRHNIDNDQHHNDIVGPWIDIPVPSTVNYNDGKWHQWHGGERPVHHKSTVNVILAQGGEAARIASKFTWDHKLDPILVFRVTNEHVEPKEPRELWVSLNDYQAHDTEADAQDYDLHLGCHHGYFHVKEVI
jgi:hypothetical protein